MVGGQNSRWRRGSHANGVVRLDGRVWLVPLLCAALAACGSTAPDCASGTILVAGACVAQGPSACGAGTMWNGDQKRCVLATDTASGDGAGNVASADALGGDAAGDTASDTADSGGGDTVAGFDVGAVDAVGCVKNCGDRVCGTDGCGGTCGDCPNAKVCSGVGVCIAPESCVPSCVDKVCGDNGCGGSCGGCADPDLGICSTKGLCVAGCVPDCVGRACGSDGCGGSCGACKTDAACSTYGSCVAKAWTCSDGKYNAKDGCDCGCGVADPDCADKDQPIIGCGLTETCTIAKCVSKIPKNWTCSAYAYDDGYLCNCTCGAADPDCDDPTHGIVDCLVGACDKKNGFCGQCKTDCAGKVCGDDGCGGSCGSCKDAKFPGCAGGKCVAKCTPSCQNTVCGGDGCGGSCGACKTGLTCSGGGCIAPAEKSCVGFCGYQTKGGCWCDAGCVKRGDCCGDVAMCFCVTDCTGKACGGDGCGGDGCGGSCGSCTTKTKPYCSAIGQCEATCKPQCGGKVCGDDGCGGSCGACASGATCTGFGQCAPASWTCIPYLYGSGGLTSSCDCGCGAPDPDCGGPGVTEGCPNAGTCAKGKAYCEASWCTSQAECNKPAWCVGAFASSTYVLKGVCQPPAAEGFAPGHSCVVDASCASQLCVGGQCRIHCKSDASCPAGQACVGVERVQSLTGKPVGVVAFCDQTKSINKSCGKNADCTTSERCLAYVDPVKLTAVARCGVAYGGGPAGVACDQGQRCQIGLVCAKGVCAPPCFGGTSDCTSKQTCAPAVLQHGLSSATADDTTVPTCQAKP